MMDEKIIKILSDWYTNHKHTWKNLEGLLKANNLAIVDTRYELATLLEGLVEKWRTEKEKELNRGVAISLRDCANQLSQLIEKYKQPLDKQASEKEKETK